MSTNTSPATQADQPTDTGNDPAPQTGDSKSTADTKSAGTGAAKPAAKPQSGKAAAAKRKPASKSKTGRRKGKASAKPQTSKPATNGQTNSRSAQPRAGSGMAAVITVLTGKPDGMKMKDIWAEISDRSLAPNLKGKTPDQTVAAQVAIHAKRGLYVERVAPGTFRLKRQ